MPIALPWCRATVSSSASWRRRFAAVRSLSRKTLREATGIPRASATAPHTVFAVVRESMNAGPPELGS